MIPFLLAALMYSVIAVYEDGSCLQVTYDAERNCRLGAPVVWCPDATDCQAADAALNLQEPLCVATSPRPSQRTQAL